MSAPTRSVLTKKTRARADSPRRKTEQINAPAQTGAFSFQDDHKRLKRRHKRRGAHSSATMKLLRRSAPQSGRKRRVYDQRKSRGTKTRTHTDILDWRIHPHRYRATQTLARHRHADLRSKENAPAFRPGRFASQL
jgi:hypothetical protein